MNFRDKAVDKSTEIAMYLTQTEIEKVEVCTHAD